MTTEDNIRRLVKSRPSTPQPVNDRYRALTPEEKAMLDARRRRLQEEAEEEENRMYAPLPPKR